MKEYTEKEALREAMRLVTDDPTCPLHIAATIDQYITEAPVADVVAREDLARVQVAYDKVGQALDAVDKFYMQGYNDAVADHNLMERSAFDMLMARYEKITGQKPKGAVRSDERKRGEWAIDKEDLEWGNALKRRYCTNCKKRPLFDNEERVFILTDFCPHCGADMRGE